MTTPDQNATSVPADRAAIEADIEATRADLGETVDALSRKLDVKSRVRSSAADTAQRVQARARQQPAIPAGVLVGLVVVVGLVVWRRRS